MGVYAVFTSTTKAPLCLATSGSDAAGWTMADVPTTSIASQRDAIWWECSYASIGSGSPYHTTSGRRSDPHVGQCGGTSDSGLSSSSQTVCSSVQRALQMLP